MKNDGDEYVKECSADVYVDSEEAVVPSCCDEIDGPILFQTMKTQTPSLYKNNKHNKFVIPKVNPFTN
jgi:hypothetical protein